MQSGTGNSVHPSQGLARVFAGLRRHEHVLTSAVLLACTVVSLWPVFWRSGWPLNHEGHVWATRAGVLQAAWQRGEWFPLWWPEGNLGLGSPMPGLYHKLQNYTYTLLLQLFEDVKTTQIASLVVFTAIGSFGLRALALELGANRWMATFLGAALPFTGYVTADWMIRGAFAEHAAFMLLPWLFVTLVRLAQHGQLPVLRLVLLLFLLFHTHSVTAMFAGLIVVLALGIAMLTHRSRAVRLALRAAGAGAAFLLTVAPSLWITRALTRNVYFAHATQGYYVVHRHLTSLANALFVGEAPRVGFSVAPDPCLWLGVGCAAGLLFWPRFRRMPALPRPNAALALVLASLVLMIGLRLKPAGLVYDWVPGLRYVQFPWRLLSFATVLLLSAFAWLLGRLTARAGSMLAGALLLALAVTGRVFHFDEKVWLPSGALQAALSPTTYIRWVEYLPAVPGPARPNQLKAWARRPAVVAGRCRLTSKDTRQVRVERCSGGATVALPHAFSGLELVTDAAGNPLIAYRTERDPRVRVDVRDDIELEYHSPSWSTAFHHLRQGRSWRE